MTNLARGALAALLLPLIAACDDDGSGPDRLEPADVQGVYSVCQLVFTPAGNLASVSLPGTAFQTEGAGIQPPVLRVDATGQVELAYTPRGGTVSQNLRGTFDMAGDGISLRLNDTGTVTRGSLLLPERVTLRYQQTPRTLTTVAGTSYSVPREDYVRLSGSDGTNLNPQISGTLSGSFQAGGCS